MKMKKETEEKINQLQVMEYNLQNCLTQKQNFQAQLLEVENALRELDGNKEECYKLVGGVLFKEKREKLIKELNSKKEVIDLRIKNLEKQENKIKEELNRIQKEVVKEMEK